MTAGAAKKSKPSMSKSQRARLNLPVARIKKHMHERGSANRVSVASSIYMTAVAEYVLAEVLQLSGNAARANKRQRIVPRHIQLAIRNDEELNRLFGHVAIADGGVTPLIQQVVEKKKSSKKSAAAADEESD